MKIEKMVNDFLKRKIPQSWRELTSPYGVQRNQRSSESPFSDSTDPTGTSLIQSVVSEQTPEVNINNDFIYLTVGIGTCTIILLLLIAILLLRKNSKNREEYKGSSILVYPTNQGKGPQFLTKEINFSLPPLRSTSLGCLNDTEMYEPEIDTECLLLPALPSHRSNSFSCYGLGVIEPALYKSTLDLDEIQWPEGHIGRIWFSLRYEPSTEKLLVSLLKAKNLPSRTVGNVNSCDPFVRLHLMPDERRYLQSKQKKKTCNPYFDETLVFQVSAKDMSDHILKLTVIDGGRPKRKCEIGHVTYQLKDLEVGDGTEQQLFKMDLEKEFLEIKSDLGEILISLLYNENLNRLTATVIEARRLKFQGDKHEAYVRLTLNQHYKNVKEKRTGISRPSRDGEITFAEGFNFKLTPSQIDTSNLAFHVFQATSGYGRDKLIGKLVLGSYMFARGKALQQWNSAIACPMEQKQEWHILCE